MKILIYLICGFFLFAKMKAETVQCPSSPSIASSDCSTPQIKTSSDLGIPSGSRKFCLYQVVTMDSSCSMGPDIVFFQIKVKYDGVNLQTAFEFKWQSSDNTFVMNAIDASGVATNLLTDTVETQVTSNTISYYACIFADESKADGGFMTKSYAQTQLVDFAAYNVLSSLDDAVFYFCHDGTNSAKCNFENTKISHSKFYYHDNSLLWGLSPALIRSYAMNEKSGNTLVDSVSGKDATLDSNAPIWSKTNYGLEFTSTDQYIKILTFIPNPADSLVISSLTVAMWIRLPSAPSVESYIFRRVSADSSKEYYSLKVTPTGFAMAMIENFQPVGSDYTLVGAWVHLSFSFSITDNVKMAFMGVGADSLSHVWRSHNYHLGHLTAFSSTSSYASDDQLIFGGPQGVLATIYGIEIYSPGSHNFGDWTCGTSTQNQEKTFGINTLPFLSWCDGSCSRCIGPDATDCLSCSTGSDGIYNSQCQSCPSGTKKIDTLCSSCPSNCDTCTTLDKCDVCSSGYALNSNNLCESCSANCKTCSLPGKCDDCSSGYAVNSNKLCDPICSSNCNTCSTPGQCDFCSSGYSLTSDKLCNPICSSNCNSCSTPGKCDICSAGYVPTSDKLCILICSDHCQSCSSSYTCDTCSPGYAPTSNKLCAPICANDCSSCSAPFSCDTCSVGFTLTRNKLCLSGFVPDTVAATNGGRTTTDTTTQIATVASNGNSAGVQAQVGGRIFIVIQYFKITYSQDVLNILANTAATPGKGDPVYVPNAPGSIRSSITERRMPDVFEKYGLSSSFLLNFWKKMTLIFMILTVVILALTMEAAGAKWKFFQAIPATVVRELAQNYLLSQLYSFTGEIVFNSSLFFRTLQFHSKSELIDFILSVLFLLAVFIVPVWHYFIILKYQKIKKSHENVNDKDVLKYFQDGSKGFKLFFENFHDKSALQQLFMIFLITRDLIFSLLLTMLFEHPLPQILILLTMNTSMIIYIIVKRPFRSIFNFVQQLFYEFLLLFALIVLLILIGLDMANSTNDNARDVLGKVLIMESLLFTYGTLVITTLSIIKTALEFIKEYKKNKAQQAQSKYLATEETPCNIVTEENESSPKEKAKLSVLDLDQEESSKGKIADEVDNSPLTSAQSEANSPNTKLLKLSSADGDLESRKSSKHKKSKTYHFKKIEDHDENSEVIDKFLELGVQAGSDSPTSYNPTKLMKRFNLMKSLRKSEI